MDNLSLYIIQLVLRTFLEDKIIDLCTKMQKGIEIHYGLQISWNFLQRHFNTLDYRKLNKMNTPFSYAQKHVFYAISRVKMP